MSLVYFKSYVIIIIYRSSKNYSNWNKYVLTFTGYYTKFVDFYPLKERAAGSVARSIKTFV